jgi:hypothetical protein
MDFTEEIESYSPHTGQAKQPEHLAYLPQTHLEASSFTPPVPVEYGERQTEVTEQSRVEEGGKETGCTRFCGQKYYEEFFQVSEQEVLERVLATVMPPFNDEFVELIRPKPDFYGPFWIMATIVLLLGVVGNFANYVLSKFSDSAAFEGYFFRLELVRYALVMVYAFGAGVPFALFLMFKVMKCNQLSFPEVPVCLGRWPASTGTRWPATCRPW